MSRANVSEQIGQRTRSLLRKIEFGAAVDEETMHEFWQWVLGKAEELESAS